MVGKITEKKIFVFLIVCISILALISFFISPFFKVQQIKVSQLTYLDNDTIKENLSMILNKNIWLISKYDIKNKLLEENYIKDARIVKKYPDTIYVNINERTPIAKINNNGKYLVFNKTGFILEEGSIKTKVKVPLVKGVGYSFADGEINFPPLFAEIVQALPVISQERRKELETINYKEREIRITLSSNANVFIGNSKQLQQKFKVLDSILKETDEKNYEIDYIDLRIIQKPVIKKKK